jgi:outer membrane protein OmpA-like peptidoglycan-associated protein
MRHKIGGHIMDWIKHLCIQVLVLSIVLCGASIVWSQESEEDEKAEQLKFPTTEEEIIKILGKDSPNLKGRGRGGLPLQDNDQSLFGSKTGARGLAGIAEDEEALAEAPKTGALVLFDYNSATIKEESKPLLRTYGKVLQGDLADAVLVIAGHTDSKGSDQYNLALSQRRAEAVKQFLVSEYHIADIRLITKPYGEGKPIASNENPEGRAKNRRVEFIRIQ